MQAFCLHSPMKLPSILFVPILLFASAVIADDAWFADTRPGTVVFSQLDANAWEASTEQKFLETFDPNIPLVVVIHGNWMALNEAKSYGKLFHRMSRDIGPHRLLIWS